MELTSATPAASLAPSLRHHPALAAIFRAAEGRHLTPDELDHYLAACPEHASRAAAAREMTQHDAPIIRALANELFELYPLGEVDPDGLVKTVRDLRHVSAYATLAMLAGDPPWLRNRLLIWLGALLRSHDFPDLRVEASRRLCRDPEIVGITAQLPAGRRVVHDCYGRLRLDLRDALTPASFAEMDPYLQATIAELSSD